MRTLVMVRSSHHGALEPNRMVCPMLDREEEERAHMAGDAAQAASLDATPPADFGRGFDPYHGRSGRGSPSGHGGCTGCGGNDRTGNDHSSDLQASISGAAVTVSAHHAPAVNSIVAVHSHALCLGRCPAVNYRFTPLANHVLILAGILAPVQIEPLETTLSYHAVTFSDTAIERSYAPEDRPRQVSTAPNTAVQLQGESFSKTAGPIQSPLPQPSGW